MGIKRHTSNDDGAVMIEFAIVFVVFLTVVLGIVDFGLAIGANTQISNASREGARLATVTTDPTQVEQRVRDAAAARFDQALLDVTIECLTPAGIPCVGGSPAGDLRNASTGDTARVTVAYPYDLITPLPGIIGFDGSVDLATITEMRIE